MGAKFNENGKIKIAGIEYEITEMGTLQYEDPIDTFREYVKERLSYLESRIRNIEKRLADIESIALEREADTRDRFDKIEKAIAELSMTPYSDQQPKVECFVRMEDFEGREIACRYMKLAKPPISGDNVVYAGLMYEVDDAAITWTREGVCTCELSVWERGNAIVF